MQRQLGEYAQALYQAGDLENAFAAFEKSVIELGFEAVLYSYIPRALIESGFHVPPVYLHSDKFYPEYMAHYAESRFDRYDPTLQAVNNNEKQAIDWWGDVCQSYKLNSLKSCEVMDVSRYYGIENGVTLPLMSGAQGVAGVSAISREKAQYSLLLADKLDALFLRARMFHGLVVSNSGYLGAFTRSLVESLSQTQMGYLRGLAAGRKTSDIAKELNTSSGYLDQSMIRLRRKLSGAEDNSAPKINRNQLLYYAGLLNIIEHES